MPRDFVFYHVSMQAVPLPEAGEVTEDPGKLPEPDKITKAYFEVRTLTSLQDMLSSRWHS